MEFKVQSIAFSGDGAVTALVVTDNNGNVVFRFGENATPADNAPKAAYIKPKQGKSKDNTGMIPKPLYARLMACKTEVELQAAIAANKYWATNPNFIKTVEKARSAFV